jgi:ABC-type uncharacterized transport system substrate-binding protein
VSTGQAALNDAILNLAEMGSNADMMDKILRGTKPGDIPVELPTKFKPDINLHTVKALTRTIPEAVLARADEVIINEELKRTWLANIQGHGANP